MTVDMLKTALMTFAADMFYLYRTEQNFKDEIDERLDEACKSELQMGNSKAPNTFLLRIALMGAAKTYAEMFLGDVKGGN